MSSKKWLVSFAFCVLLCVIFIMALNVFADPMGAFGDKVLNWFSYDMSNNPRIAKITYLDENSENYDSYIIGCSCTSSLNVDDFNKYLGGSFYNMIMYGADMLDVEETVSYMLKNYTVKNLVLNVFVSNTEKYDTLPDKVTYSLHYKVSGELPISYYSRYLLLNPNYAIDKLVCLKNDTYVQQYFDVFNAETGSYDKTKRDAEPILNLDRYHEAYPAFTDYPIYSVGMEHISDTLGSIERIRDMCADYGVNLITVASPAYEDHLRCFDSGLLSEFFTSLADITPFWDFTLSSVSCEERYFYDETHFRNSVGKMMAARIFGDDSVYVPEDFGVYVTPDNADKQNYDPDRVASDLDSYTANVPVLLYHHLAQEGQGDTIISAERFAEQMKYLYDNGYNTVSMQQLIDYVEKGEPLPDKPVCLTFDDGYQSNYDIAYPILCEYGFQATIFVIGEQVGKDTYKDTGSEMLAHFSYETALEMVASGLISIQSHTYDMHQWPPLENTDTPRENILPLEGESEKDYIEVLRADNARVCGEIYEGVGETVTAVSYPTGKYTLLTQMILNEEGIKITFSTNVGTNNLVMGLPQCLYGMLRYNMTEDTTLKTMQTYLDGTFTW